MTHDEIRAFVDLYVHAWERQDVDELIECYTPAADITSPMFHDVRGHEAIEASFRDLFRIFGDIKVSLDDVIVDTEPEPRAALLMNVDAVHRGAIFGFPSSSHRVETHMIFVLRFERDRIASERRIYDFTGLLFRLGVLKAKGG